MDLPDYHGGSIVNLMASLQLGLGGEPHEYAPLRLLPPDRVSNHRQVILWVIDGLGYDYLRNHPEASCLNSALQGRVTSVYPPTTASAITTFLTGEAPQQHGLTGWFIYFRELGTILSVLPGRTRFGREVYGRDAVDVDRLLKHRPFFDRIAVESYSLAPAYISDSEFNLAHLGSATRVGYRSLDELCDSTLEICRRPGKRYLYIYWPELDSIGHRAGIGSGEAQRHLLQLDRAFDALRLGLRGSDTLLLVIADHGQIDSSPEQTLMLEQIPGLSESLVMPLCGEPRSAYCYLRPGREAIFDRAVRDHCSELIDAYPSSRLIDENWFGLGEPHRRLTERIGDRVLLLKKSAIIHDRLEMERPYSMIGAHGGLSQAELWVPFIEVVC